MSIKKSPYKLAITSLVTFAIILSLSFQGVFAWLFDFSNMFSNVFNIHTVSVGIVETDTDDGDGDELTNSYAMVLGEDVEKDPTVVFPGNSLDSWVFIKIAPSTNFSEYMTFEVADGWEVLGEDYPGVYYRPVSSSSEDQKLAVLENDRVRLQSDVVEDDLNELELEPTLRVTAYAIQQAEIDDPVKAWEILGSD